MTILASTCNRPCRYVRPSLQVRASEMNPFLPNQEKTENTKTKTST